MPTLGTTERIAPKERNECPVDIQVKAPRQRIGGRMGGWAIAQSPILGTTITTQRLKKRLYESLLDVFFRLNPSLYEPPYTCLCGGGYEQASEACTVVLLHFITGG
jgi:hypothetical protein